MNIHSFQSFAAALILFSLALFIYLKNRKNPINGTFSILLLCLSMWNLGVFGVRSAPNDDFAEIWGRVFRPGLIFIPAVGLHFVIKFIGLSLSSKKIKWLLYVAYANSISFAIINWTPYFTGDAIKFKWGYSVQTGPLYGVFMASFFVLMGINFGLLIRNYFKVDQYQKQRIKYFLLALIISFFFGIVGFLPMLGYEIYPFGNIGLTAGFFIVSYTIVQNRLMDVSIFLAKGLGLILALTLLAIPSGIIITYLQKIIFQQASFLFTSSLISIGIIAIFLFRVVREKLDIALHQIIVKDKYFYHRVLKDFSRRLVTIVDLTRLINDLANTIKQSMGISRINIFLYFPEKEDFRLRLNHGEKEDFLKNISYQKESILIQLLERKKEVILRPEIENLARGEKEIPCLRNWKY